MAKGYKYIVANKIIDTTKDEYRLSENEYFKLYSFYVTYSMCGSQSQRKRGFVEYGWESETIKNSELGWALAGVLNLNKNPDFVFTDKENFSHEFVEHDLIDGILSNVDIERAVVCRTGESHNYFRLFYRVRDGFAHGKFQLRYSSNREKMVVIQDDDSHSVTARMVLKLDTLLKFIDIIDLNNLIQI